MWDLQDYLELRYFVWLFWTGRSFIFCLFVFSLMIYSFVSFIVLYLFESIDPISLLTTQRIPPPINPYHILGVSSILFILYFLVKNQKI